VRLPYEKGRPPPNYRRMKRLPPENGLIPHANRIPSGYAQGKAFDTAIIPKAPLHWKGSPSPVQAIFQNS